MIGLDVGTGGAAVVTLPDTTPPAAPTSGLELFSEVVAGRSMPAVQNSTDAVTPLQASLFGRHVGFWNIAGPIGVIGVNALTPVALGTLTARAPSATSMALSIIRTGFVSPATANSITGLYDSSFNNVAQYHRGSVAGAGGFFVAFRFMISDAVLVSTANMLVGLHFQNSAPVDGAPSALTQLIGVGCDSGDTHLQLYASGAAAQARIDLGASFPANTTNTDLYELVLFAPPNGTSIAYRVTRINTGDTVTGVVNAAASLVSSGTFIGPRVWRSNGSTAAAVGIDLVRAYFETET